MYPLIELVIQYVTQTYSMMKDQGVWNPWMLEEFPENTKCNSVAKYYNLYAGPEYRIHYKLAAIQNIIAITFMFGTALPILFPIGSFAFFVLYYVERYTIAKLYR